MHIHNSRSCDGHFHFLPLPSFTAFPQQSQSLVQDTYRTHYKINSPWSQTPHRLYNETCPICRCFPFQLFSSFKIFIIFSILNPRGYRTISLQSNHASVLNSFLQPDIPKILYFSAEFLFAYSTNTLFCPLVKQTYNFLSLNNTPGYTTANRTSNLCYDTFQTTSTTQGDSTTFRLNKQKKIIEHMSVQNSGAFGTHSIFHLRWFYLPSLAIFAEFQNEHTDAENEGLYYEVSWFKLRCIVK